MISCTEWVLAGLVMTFVGCASQRQRRVDAPPPEPTSGAERSSASADEHASVEEQPEAATALEGAIEPRFESGMSVREATDAVPQNVDRLNIEQERLAEPFMKPELYEPCSLKETQHFKLKVAVWDGRAVGLDLETSPSNETLERCLRAQISQIEWEDKEKSLNTVEYSY